MSPACGTGCVVKNVSVVVEPVLVGLGRLEVLAQLLPLGLVDQRAAGADRVLDGLVGRRDLLVVGALALRRPVAQPPAGHELRRRALLVGLEAEPRVGVAGELRAPRLVAAADRGVVGVGEDAAVVLLPLGLRALVVDRAEQELHPRDRGRELTERRHLRVRRDVGPVQVAVEDRARRHVLARPLGEREHGRLVGGERLRRAPSSPSPWRRPRSRPSAPSSAVLKASILALTSSERLAKVSAGARRSGRVGRGRRLGGRGIAREQAPDGGVARAALEPQQQRLRRRLRRPHARTSPASPRLFRPVLPHPRPILSDSRGARQGPIGPSSVHAVRGEQQPAQLLGALARPAASPSAAATIEPFIRMCHWRANASGSATPASAASPARNSRITLRCWTLATRPGSSRSVSSSITLMNEQPSKSGRANHSPKTSKIASSRAAGVARAALDLGLQPAARPALLAGGEEGDDQLVLGREVAVQRHLRRARLVDDAVHADGARAVLGEQLVGRVQDPLAPFGHDRSSTRRARRTRAARAPRASASSRISSSEKCRRKRSRTPSRCVGRAVASSSAPFSVSTA